MLSRKIAAELPPPGVPHSAAIGAAPADVAFLEDMVRRATYPARHYPPPGGSAGDWAEEALAEGMLCALQALGEFDPRRGVPLECFLRSRVAAGVLRFYRRRQGHARRLGPLANAAELPDPASGGAAWAAVEQSLLGEAVAALPEDDRRLIERRYFEGGDGPTVAVERHVTKQSLHNRERKLLERLRRALDGAETGRGSA